MPGEDAGAVYEEVPFAELEYVESDDMYYFQCPCGDMFEISSAQLARGERIARCPSCSLAIRVLHHPDDDVSPTPAAGAASAVPSPPTLPHTGASTGDPLGDKPAAVCPLGRKTSSRRLSLGRATPSTRYN